MKSKQQNQQNKPNHDGRTSTTTGRFRRDQRGVSELLGAVLFFGLLVILLVLAQVTLVPALNQQVEYEHSLRAQDDFGDLQSSTFRVASSGSPERVSLELGVTYPNRPLLINPAPVQGTVRTVEPTDLTITGVSAVNDETDQFWTASPLAGAYDTRTVRYEAGYNEYGNAGTVVYENSVLYKQFSGGRNVATGDQAPLIEGNRITIVTMTGDLSQASQRAETVSLSPVSAPLQSIAVRNASATDPITITTATDLTTEEWTQLIGDESAVESLSVTGGVLTVELQPGNYQLRLARVGIGENPDRAAAAYLTRGAEMNNVVPNEGGQVSVEVRDRYNNPVSGAEVTYVITDGPTAELTVGNEAPVGEGETITAVSDENGLATVTVSGGDDDVQLRAFKEMDGDPFGLVDYEKVEFGVQVGTGTPATGGGDGDFDDINPNREGRLVLQDVYVSCDGGGSSCGTNDDTSRLVTVFENNVPGQAVTIETIRINAYQANGPGASADDFPDFARVLYGNNTVVQPSNDDITVEVRGPSVPEFGNLPVATVPDGSTDYQLRLKLYVDDGDGTWEEAEDDVHVMPGGDTMLVTLKYSYFDADGNVTNVTSSYLLTPYHDTSAPSLSPAFDVDLGSSTVVLAPELRR